MSALAAQRTAPTSGWARRSAAASRLGSPAAAAAGRRRHSLQVRAKCASISAPALHLLPPQPTFFQHRLTRHLTLCHPPAPAGVRRGHHAGRAAEACARVQGEGAAGRGPHLQGDQQDPREAGGAPAPMLPRCCIMMGWPKAMATTTSTAAAHVSDNCTHIKCNRIFG